ncbi:MAG TPA: DNA polymerase III subunit alpha [Verrucomicrobiales bacterium]|nr:DNA polymerase III subunit alpha [Verrucomicrobiales bacterium]
MTGSFVHLHLHTEYSTLDGAVRCKEVAARAAELGMPAVAMTDHGNLYGAIEFYEAVREKGVKPILGCEIYLAPESMEHRQEIPGRRRATHLTLLAENNTGWENLVQLVTKGHLEGSYYGKPRVDRQELRAHAEGIICLSGCIAGPVNEWLLQRQSDKAREMLEELREIFGRDNLYVEIHDHGLEAQHEVKPQLIKLARELDLGLVAANDVHFLSRDDHEAHDVMICIGTGKLVFDEKRMRYPAEVYFKSAEEMREVFQDIPEACDNTLEIAERCNVTLSLDATSSEKYPNFEAPGGMCREAYIRQQCFEGLEERYGKERAESDQDLRERLEYEIKTINDLGFNSYFLITADFINWAKEHGIPVGPGRGSAAGSLVAYTLGITNICPKRFGLLFERFLNPERVSPPDVDIDFCQTRRSEVIDYVRQKYGERCVSHIITYGSMGAKSVIRDVARVMGVSYGEADRIAKMIEARPGVKLKEEFENKPELRETIESSTTYRELWDYAVKLEGLTRNTGVHAAGVVIGDRPLDQHVPLSRGNEGEVVTQYDMGAITEVGLLKMDFLGLKNLTVIQEATDFIRGQDPDFEIHKVPLDDQPTFDLLNRGETMGVFQLESGGMTETCRRYGIRRIDDIIDLLALYRPGAMQFINEMIEVKEGRKEVKYEHPLLEQVCGDTYGVMIYQEQVQNAAKLLAGYTLGGADILRRAMSKKKQSEMDKQRAAFVAGCKSENNIDKHLANRIFDKIASFAGYGFNKSHSACYAHISYWTAYLKANFPVEFMAGLLSNEFSNTDKVGVFVSECHRMDIEILPPDVNRSQLRFAPEKIRSGKMAIRYGLAAIKNVGEGAMAQAIAEREGNGAFQAMDDFAKRQDSRVVNKRILENLVLSGAMDWTRETRAGMCDRLEEVCAAAGAAQRDRESGQEALFGDEELAAPAARHEMPEWPKDERLEKEKELLGYYVTGHPLDKYRVLLSSDSFCKLGLLDDLNLSDRRARFPFAGMIRKIEQRVTRKGKPFGILVIEDFTGSQEVLCWGESYIPARDAGILEEGRVIALKGEVSIDDRTESRKIMGSSLKELKLRQGRNGQNGGGPLELSLWVSRSEVEDLEEIQSVLASYPGETPVLLHMQSGTGKRATIECGEQFRVHKSESLTAALGRWMD